MSALISTITTVICVLIFLGMVYYAFAPAYRNKWEEASRIPFEETDEPSSPSAKPIIGA